MSAWNDFNSADEQTNFDVIPKDTLAKVRLQVTSRLQVTATHNLSERSFDLDGLAVSATGSDEACAGRSMFGLSLCAGAGGLDLGLHLALPKYRTVGYVERDAYAAATLVARMEDAALDCAPVWDDVTTFDSEPWRGLVDIIHGGYPCQPFSIAGRKRAHDDPRHLWPHIARIVADIGPGMCFFENVGNHLRLGFEQVHDDLQRMGYRVKTGLFTAAEVGAPHKRERLFIMAYRPGVFRERSMSKGNRGGGSQGPSRSQGANMAYATRTGAGHYQRHPRHIAQRNEQSVGDTNRPRLEGRRADQQQYADAGQPFPPGPTDAVGWREYLSQRPELEPAVRRSPDGMANRVDRLRLCGNGVVPMVAAHAFRTLTAIADIEI